MFCICFRELRSLITKSKKLLEQCGVLGFLSPEKELLHFSFKGAIVSMMKDKYLIEYKCLVVMDEFKSNGHTTRILLECEKALQDTLALFYTPLTDNDLLFVGYSQLGGD